MLRKLAMFFVIFFLLVSFNIVVAQTLISNRRVVDARKIFDEIDESSHSEAPLVLGVNETAVEVGDARVTNLQRFFRHYNSDLYDYAKLIVEVSDKYKFDYRVLPAIAMQESTLCKFIPPDSHNCWGWGIYGDQVLKFDSYDEAIEAVAYGIRKDYIEKGLVTASAIMKKYTPPSQGSWATGVNTVVGWLE